MKKVFFILTLGFFLHIAANAAVFDLQDDFRPRIVAVNLWSSAIDIQLGDQPVFSVKGLAPFTPTSVRAVDYCARPFLYYKASSDSSWKIVSDTSGKPVEFNFNPWSIQILRVESSGTIKVVPVARVRSGSAHCAFVNAAGQRLEEMSLVDMGFISKIHVKDIPDQAFTNFSDIVAGSYGAAWHNRNLSAFTYGNQNGVLGLVPIKSDTWYLVIASPGSDTRDAVRIWKLGEVQPFVISD